MLPPYEDEDLPGYKPALTLSGAMYTKRELSSPFRRSFNRSWKPTWVVLDNTQLKLTRGTLVSRERAYTLQYAEIGFASDYDKRQHTLRIRLEGFQFLFALESHAECWQWVQAVQTAIGLALPLELRTLPEDKRRRRRRRRHRRRDGENRSRDQSSGDNTNTDAANADAADPAEATPETTDNVSPELDYDVPLPENAHLDTLTPAPQTPRLPSFDLSPSLTGDHHRSGSLSPSDRDNDDIEAEQDDGELDGDNTSAGTSATASVNDDSCRSTNADSLDTQIDMLTIGDKSPQPELQLVVTHGLDEEEPDQASSKWSPTRRRSRVSAFDFPHLPMNLSWEGKKILYRGRWAVVRKRQITEIYMS